MDPPLVPLQIGHNIEMYRWGEFQTGLTICEAKVRGNVDYVFASTWGSLCMIFIAEEELPRLALDFRQLADSPVQRNYAVSQLEILFVGFDNLRGGFMSRNFPYVQVMFLWVSSSPLTSCSQLGCSSFGQTHIHEDFLDGLPYLEKLLFKSACTKYHSGNLGSISGRCEGPRPGVSGICGQIDNFLRPFEGNRTSMPYLGVLDLNGQACDFSALRLAQLESLRRFRVYRDFKTPPSPSRNKDGAFVLFGNRIEYISLHTAQYLEWICDLYSRNATIQNANRNYNYISSGFVALRLNDRGGSPFAMHKGCANMFSMVPLPHPYDSNGLNNYSRVDIAKGRVSAYPKVAEHANFHLVRRSKQNFIPKVNYLNVNSFVEVNQYLLQALMARCWDWMEMMIPAWKTWPFHVPLSVLYLSLRVMMHDEEQVQVSGSPSIHSRHNAVPVIVPYGLLDNSTVSFLIKGVDSPPNWMDATANLIIVRFETGTMDEFNSSNRSLSSSQPLTCGLLNMVLPRDDLLRVENIRVLQLFFFGCNFRQLFEVIMNAHDAMTILAWTVSPSRSSSIANPFPKLQHVGFSRKYIIDPAQSSVSHLEQMPFSLFPKLTKVTVNDPTVSLVSVEGSSLNDLKLHTFVYRGVSTKGEEGGIIQPSILGQNHSNLPAELFGKEHMETLTLSDIFVPNITAPLYTGDISRFFYIRTAEITNCGMKALDLSCFGAPTCENSGGKLCTGLEKLIVKNSYLPEVRVEWYKVWSIPPPKGPTAISSVYLKSNHIQNVYFSHDLMPTDTAGANSDSNSPIINGIYTSAREWRIASLANKNLGAKNRSYEREVSNKHGISIELDDNELIGLSPKSFVDMRSLFFLSLANNRISWVEPGFIAGKSCMAHGCRINLGDNRLGEGDVDAFVRNFSDHMSLHRTPILQLELRNNSFKRFPFGIGSVFNTLDTMWSWENRGNVDVHSAYAILDLEHNSIETIPESVCKGLNVSRGVELILYVNLANNRIKRLADKAFDCPRNVKLLVNLDGNTLTHFPGDASYLRSVVLLSAKRSNITATPLRCAIQNGEVRGLKSLAVDAMTSDNPNELWTCCTLVRLARNYPNLGSFGPTDILQTWDYIKFLIDLYSSVKNYNTNAYNPDSWRYINGTKCLPTKAEDPLQVPVEFEVYWRQHGRRTEEYQCPGECTDEDDQMEDLADDPYKLSLFCTITCASIFFYVMVLLSTIALKRMSSKIVYDYDEVLMMSADVNSNNQTNVAGEYENYRPCGFVLMPTGSTLASSQWEYESDIDYKNGYVCIKSSDYITTDHATPSVASSAGYGPTNIVSQEPNENYIAISTPVKTQNTN
eukprot:Nk52_evm3s267 gene=Nk52_evmTU3s267